MSDLRIGNSVRSVAISSTGFDKVKGKTEKFANIFGDIAISVAAENTKLCQEEGIMGAKSLKERELADLTKTPPLRKNIQAPYYT